MQQSIKIAERIINVGDRLRGNMNAPERGLCPEDHIVTVQYITDEGMVGLYSERRLSGWSDLDGEVPNRQGFWASRDCIHDNFVPVDVGLVVKRPVKFKNRDLQGMKCKILRALGDRKHVFVEMEENVGGGSADGLGRAGHCVLLEENILAGVPKKKKKAVKRKTKKKEG